MDQEKIIIDKEFDAVCRELTKEELETLKESLKRDGCYDPLKVWAGKNILLDGHNRLRLCRELNIPFQTVEVEATDRDAAWDLIYVWQMGRRNLSEIDRYALTEKKRERTARLAKERQACGQGGILLAPNRGQATDRHERSTIGALAKEAGMSRTTYERVGRVVKNGIPEVVQATREKKISISRAERIAALPKEEQAEALSGASIGKRPRAFSIGDVLDNCILKMEEMLKTLLLREDYGELDPEFARNDLLPRLTKEERGVRPKLKKLIDRIKEAAHEE